MHKPIAQGDTRRWPLFALAAFFAATGISHFVVPGYFEAIVPPCIPNAPLMVAISGVAEFAGGIGVIPRRTRRAAGWGLVALLIAVFPANVYAWQSAQAGGESRSRELVLLLRLPLQGLLIWWVWRVAIRRARDGR